MPPIRGRQADAASSASPGRRPNTIGVGERDLGDLLDRLDDRQASSEGAIKRTYARWPFRHGSLQLVLEHPGGSKATFQTACRNLSRGGMGVLHNAFVHANTPCKVVMPRLDSRRQTIDGTVVRCTHTQGLVHELGIRFGEAIQLGDYVELDPLMGWSSFEKVEPQKLAGALMVVTHSELDERIIGHYLGDTRLKIQFMKSAADAAGVERCTADVALIDLEVQHAQGLFSTLRERGAAESLVAIGADASTSTRMLLQKIEADGFVFKPLSSDRLLSVLADCLLAGDAVQIDPVLAGAGSGVLVRSCIEQLQNCAAEIRDGVAADDPMRCYAICQHVKAISIPIGLRPIAKMADQAANSVAQTMNVRESGVKLQELIRSCERIRISTGPA